MAVLSTEDEGKFLMDIEGEQIGIVSDVDTEEQVAYVDPDAGIAEAWIESFGYGNAEEDDIRVPATSVETVTDSELRVATDL
jgi:sporulation protein YlmC with PRC-barrel domain